MCVYMYIYIAYINLCTCYVRLSVSLAQQNVVVLSVLHGRAHVPALQQSEQHQVARAQDVLGLSF